MLRSVRPINRDPDLMWTTIPVPKEKKLIAWIAGPVVGLMTHYLSGRTVPCLAHATANDLPCPVCEHVNIRWTGWVPVYVEPGLDRKVIMISSTVYDKIIQIPVHSPVGMQLPAQGKKPVTLSSVSDYELTHGNAQRVQKRGIANISRYLVNLFNLPLLTNWAAKQAEIAMGDGEILPLEAAA